MTSHTKSRVATECSSRPTADYRALFDGIDQGFCTIEVLFDAHGTPIDYCFVDTNRAFDAQTGLHDVVGRRIRDIAPLEEHWFRTYGEVAKTGTPVRFERQVTTSGRWYEGYAFRIGDPARHHVAVLFNDITDRRRAQEARDATQQQLQRSEAAHAAARRAAEQASQFKDRFLAMVGHEFRNPLAAMMAALQLMRRRGCDSREQDVLERQVTHMSRMVEDLLDLSRISRGAVALRREPVELMAVVRQAMELSGPILHEQQDSVEILVPEEHVLIDVDRDRMAQAIANLLTNAAKYSDPGSRIQLLGSHTDGVIRLSVRDEGVGLAPEVLEHVFEPFTQQEQSAESSRGGLGLGLAIVRTLVEAHGGTVRATSDGVGHGSEFTIEVPAAVASS